MFDLYVGKYITLDFFWDCNCGTSTKFKNVICIVSKKEGKSVRLFVEDSFYCPHCGNKVSEFIDIAKPKFNLRYYVMGILNYLKIDTDKYIKTITTAFTKFS